MAVAETKPESLDLGEYGRARRGFPDFLEQNRRALSALLVFVVLLLALLIANPAVFLSSEIYQAVFVPLPMRVVMVLPLVFVIVSGEIDLSFIATMTLGTWIFALGAQAGWSPFLAALLAMLAGALVGLVNGVLVTRLGLASMVVTLGMGFLVRGLVVGATSAMGISLTFLKGTPFYNLFLGQVGILPAQFLWMLVYIALAILLFYHHRFGSHTHCVGDNLESSREMGINAARTKTLAFIYLGIGAAIAGILSGLIYESFWPRIGDPSALMMPVLASVFIGGTPTWGGVGSVVGAVFGAFIIKFIETGVIEAGLTGFWTQFFNGLIILLALTAQKLQEPRYRY